MHDDGPERRRAERVPVNAEFGAMPAMVYVSDLSEHGVFVHTERRIAVGTAVHVRFTVLLDDPVVIGARGRVVRHQDDPPGLGIEFTRVAPEMVLRLGDIVTQQRPRDLLVPSASVPAVEPRRSTVPPSPAGNTRVTKPPIEPPGDTKVVTAPQPPPDAEAFDANQTLVKLQAVDVEILDDDDDFDHDSDTSGP
jgi:hypothetical protein